MARDGQEPHRLPPMPISARTRPEGSGSSYATAGFWRIPWFTFSASAAPARFCLPDGQVRRFSEEPSQATQAHLHILKLLVRPYVTIDLVNRADETAGNASLVHPLVARSNKAEAHQVIRTPRYGLERQAGVPIGDPPSEVVARNIVSLSFRDAWIAVTSWHREQPSSRFASRHRVRLRKRHVLATHESPFGRQGPARVHVSHP